MQSSLHDAESLLAIDVGEIATRAVLFDVVEGRYRFLAVGSAPTTAGAPYHDIGEGMRLAIRRLEEVTGRRLLGEDERLILPGAADGSGVDALAASLSAGAPLRLAVIGLLEDLSLESARRLAATTYAQVVETLSLNDRRRAEARVDAILSLRPDVVLIAGGTDEGASQSVLRMVEALRMACQLLPKEQRPEVLFVGNQALAEAVRNSLAGLASLRVAPNVRPALDFEWVESAQKELVEVFRDVRLRQIGGVAELNALAGRQLLPTAAAFGRIVRFLSKVYDPAKGVLGIDVGASATTVAAAFVGELTLGVYPQLGLGKGLPGLLQHNTLEQVTRWLPLEVGDEYVRDYVHNKALYPASLPASAEELAIELALARQAIQTAVALASPGFRKRSRAPYTGILPWFEPVVAAGSVLTRAPSPAHAAMVLLDALQPSGVTTLVLDQSNLAALLGSAASINPVLAVQVLESNTFLSLGTVISPVANVRPGVPVLRVRATYESGDEIKLEVKQGALEILPLPMGQSARLYLQPLHRSEVGMGGAGRGGSVRVMGGALGVVIDARGRPLPLPEDSGRRRELLKKWLWTLGG